MNQRQMLGSRTAKNGFKNEEDIKDKFINWQNDEDAQAWLNKMNYNISDIRNVDAIILPHKYKADIQVQISIYLKDAISTENISIKLVSNALGFNQMDRGWVDRYSGMWCIPEDVNKLLKQFVGEVSPEISGRDNRRIYLDEMSVDQQSLILNFFINNKLMIVTDIFKGRDRLTADWFMVAHQWNQTQRWILVPISIAMNYFGNGDVRVTKRGNLAIGNITMQRKGGDGGRKTANMLQFKINPLSLFDKDR